LTGTKCGRVKLVNGISTLPLLMNDKKKIKKTIKNPAQIHFHLKRPHTITKMNDNKNMDSKIAEN
jgi:hypothetical protein